MIQIQRLKTKDIGLSANENLPSQLLLLTDIKKCTADLDIIIGSHNQSQATNLTIDNYLSLEKNKSLHILVVESSRNPLNFMRIRSGKNISKILILSEIPCTKKQYDSWFWASNGVAIAVQIGMYLGRAKYAFFSHSDMMGYKENFLSFLHSKLSENQPIASFTQRHVLPFSGGMLFDKHYFHNLDVNWLPCKNNPYSISGLDRLRDRIEDLNWTDAGEKLILTALNRGQTAYICASRGATGNYYGHPLQGYNLNNEEVQKSKVPIEYAPDILSSDRFKEKYPELALEKIAMWRKSFDDEGNVIFIHRGRGTTKGKQSDRRGDFISFVREFNQNIKRQKS
jgi:hypothetical protein